MVVLNRSGISMAWNVFKFCTALKGLGSIMVLVVLAIVGVTYYVEVVECYGPDLLSGRVGDALVAFGVLLLFHGLLGLLLWSYFATILTDPGGVPLNWMPKSDEETGETDALNTVTETYDPLDGRIRVCRKCNQLKPPRCHHCSVCGRCILKMDHHCVWVVNCVGAMNYKFFLLFLFYTFLETTLVAASLLPRFLAFFEDILGDPGILATTFLVFVLNLAFSLSLLGFLIMHLSMVARNTTTIEAFEKKTSTRWLYDIGRRKNFEQVFGTDKQYWLIPAYTKEDLASIPAIHGLEYPTRPDPMQEF